MNLIQPLICPPALAPLQLGDHSVHLWLLQTDALAPEWLEQRLPLLSPDERERADRFKRGRSGFIASRLLLRSVLGRYLQRAPESLVFARSPQGKPQLSDAELGFNLSHSGNYALLALGQFDHLGVDLEQLNKARDLMAIAEHFFAPSELEWLKTLTGEAQTCGFYRLWTLKEATFKALGTGISTGLDKLCFSLQGEQIHLDSAPELRMDSRNWQFWQGQLGQDYHCALSLAAAQPPALSWFDALALVAGR